MMSYYRDTRDTRDSRNRRYVSRHVADTLIITPADELL